MNLFSSSGVHMGPQNGHFYGARILRFLGWKEDRRIGKNTLHEANKKKISPFCTLFVRPHSLFRRFLSTPHPPSNPLQTAKTLIW